MIPTTTTKNPISKNQEPIDLISNKNQNLLNKYDTDDNNK